MNQETFDTITLAPDTVGDDRYLLADNVLDPDSHLQRQTDRPAVSRARRADRHVDGDGRARRHGQRQRDETRARWKPAWRSACRCSSKKARRSKCTPRLASSRGGHDRSATCGTRGGRSSGCRSWRPSSSCRSASGIGVNTAVFSWVQAMFLQPLPGVAGASRLYLVEPRNDTGSYPGASWLEYLDLKQRMTGAARSDRLPHGAVQRGRAADASNGPTASSCRATTSRRWACRPRWVASSGRTKRDKAGGEPVAVVSHDYWQTHLNGDPKVLGRTIRVNGLPITIIGVAPRGFQGTVLMLKFDLWVPATIAPTLLAGSRELDDRSLRGYSVAGVAGAVEHAGAVADRARSDDERAGEDVSGDQREDVRGEVLPFWDAPRGPQRMLGTRAADAPRADAAAPPRRVRQHRQPDAGARERAPARGRHAARARRRTVARRQPAADRERRAGAAVAPCWARRLRCGRRKRCVRCPSSAHFRSEFQTQHRRRRARLRDRARGAVRSVLRSSRRPSSWRAIDPQTALRAGCADGRPQRAAQHADGGAGRSRARRADGRRPVPAKLRRDARHRSRLQARGRAARRLRPVGQESVASSDARLHRPPARSTAGAAERGRGRRSRRLSRSTSTACRTARSRWKAAPRPTPRQRGRCRTPSRPTISRRWASRCAKARGSPTCATPRRRRRRSSTKSSCGATSRPARRSDEPWKPAARTFTIVGVVRQSVNESFGEKPTPVIYLSYRDRPSPAGEIHLRTRAGAELAARAAGGTRRA